MRRRGMMGRRRMGRAAMRRHRRRRRRRVLLVGGLVAYGAYKFSKRDAQRIEEDAGKPPEEMSDAELEYEMEKLQIEKQYRDKNDQEQPSYVSELEELAKLRDQGVITKEDYEAKKKQLLGI